MVVMTAERNFAHSHPEYFRDSEAISRPAVGGPYEKLKPLKENRPSLFCVNSVYEVRDGR